MATSFLTDYVGYASECTDAAEDFHWWSGLAVVSSVIGNNVYYQYGHVKLRPNLWMLLVAPSSTYRKTTAMRIAYNLVQAAAPSNILPNEYSIEALIEYLGKNPSGTFFISEFKSFTGQMQREYMSGAKAFLTDMFDCPDTYVRQLRGKESIKISEVCISLLGATTQDWMQDSFKEKDLAGGFLPRFLLIIPRAKGEPQALPGDADFEKRQRLLEQLAKIRSVGGTRDPEKGRMTMSANVKAVYQGWFSKFEHEFCKGGIWDSFYTRLETYCIKLAMIKELCDTYQTEISAESMKWAGMQMRHLAKDLQTFRDNIAFTKHAQAQNKILSILTENPGGILWRDMLRRSHFSKRALMDVLDTLQAGERVMKTKDGKTTRWTLKVDE